MAVVMIEGALAQKLARAGISEGILDNCRNSKFLVVQYDGDEIMGVCFVSGFLNNAGTEVSAKYRGRGTSRALLQELLGECRRRKMSFLTGVFKPSNAPSIRAHTGVGYVPVFTFHYSRAEGKEIVTILPLNRRGALAKRLLCVFDKRVGNAAFALFIKGTRPLLKTLLGFSANVMPPIDLKYSLGNFEKVADTIEKHDLRIAFSEFRLSSTPENDMLAGSRNGHSIRSHGGYTCVLLDGSMPSTSDLSE